MPKLHPCSACGKLIRADLVVHDSTLCKLGYFLQQPEWATMLGNPIQFANCKSQIARFRSLSLRNPEKRYTVYYHQVGEVWDCVVRTLPKTTPVLAYIQAGKVEFIADPNKRSTTRSVSPPPSVPTHAPIG